MQEEYSEALPEKTKESLLTRLRRECLEKPGLASVLIFLAIVLAGAILGFAVTAWRGGPRTAQQTAYRDQAAQEYQTAQKAQISEEPDPEDEGRGYLRNLESKSLLPVRLAYARSVLLDNLSADYVSARDLLLTRSEKRRQAADLIRQSREVPEGEELWKAFSKSVILGDSRVTGFNVYHYLPEKRILAEISATVKDVDNYLDQLDKLKPDRIYISYGINDIAIFPSMSAEEYADLVVSKAKMLWKRYPEATVCVNSILPAQKAALERGPIWERLPAYSDAIGAACDKAGICYIDNAQLAEEHKDLFAEDGVHVVSEFYPLWARNMLSSAQVYEAQRLLEEDEGDE